MSAGESGRNDRQTQLLSWGRETLRLEAASIETAAVRLNDAFAGAADTLLRVGGKVVVTGLGKSGHVARKIASTFSSLGTSSFFLHPTEALHGDFGTLAPADCLLAIAFGGETNEVIEVARYARRIGVPVIVITGRLDSTLAQLGHFVIDGSVDREADPEGLAPTCSSTVALAIGDALATVLTRARGFTATDFARLHPGGSLGRRLSRVQDHMHSAEKMPSVTPDADFHAVLEAVTKFNFGIVAVMSEAGGLLGAISDGDLRRALTRHSGAALAMKAADLMSRNPKTVLAGTLAIDALSLMSEKQITQLFVMEGASAGRVAGLVRLHDLLAAKII